MGILNFFAKPPAPLLPLPRGSFTVDPDARVLVSTLPNNFPLEFAEDIAIQVLNTFKQAAEAHLPDQELVVRFANLKLTARSLRGGAIIFLVPQTLSSRPR